MKKISVVLADDHPMVREGMKLLLNGQPDMEVVGEAGDGRQACELARSLQPDVLVLDVMMSGTNGIEAAMQLKRENSPVRVIGLTAYEAEDYLRQFLAAGASGYVLKHSAAEELTTAIRKVAAGQVYFDPAVMEAMAARFASTPAHAEQPVAVLSEREKAVLRLSAMGYSNKEIAAQLDIGVRTVETYKARLMEKMAFRSRIELVRYALSQGWLEKR